MKEPICLVLLFAVIFDSYLHPVHSLVMCYSVHKFIFHLHVCTFSIIILLVCCMTKLSADHLGYEKKQNSRWGRGGGIDLPTNHYVV